MLHNILNRFSKYTGQRVETSFEAAYSQTTVYYTQTTMLMECFVRLGREMIFEDECKK
jgi:hypothetical protein